MQLDQADTQHIMVACYLTLGKLCNDVTAARAPTMHLEMQKHVCTPINLGHKAHMQFALAIMWHGVQDRSLLALYMVANRVCSRS